MIKSMTGYGRGSCSGKDKNINVEIKALNSKFLDLKIVGIKIDYETEIKINEIISNTLKRGNIKISISYDGLNKGQELVFDKERLKAIQNIVQEVNVSYNQKIELKDIINANDILGYVDTDISNNSDLIIAIKNAIIQLEEMRCSEGEKILEDIIYRVRLIRDYLLEIKNHTKKLSKDKFDDLSDSIENIIGKNKMDENRLMQEVAYLIERSDITEEIIRTDIHLDKFIEYTDMKEPVGKRLNFLIQEIYREINTIGSKSPQAEVTCNVVEIKNELEKIREQIQNIL